LKVEVRPARAGVRGTRCRAIAGGRMMTMSPVLACMRIGNTERCHGTACSCVPSRPLEHRLWAGNVSSMRSNPRLTPPRCQAGVSSHAARIARSKVGPHIMCVPCPCCPRHCSAGNACRCARNAPPVPLHALEYAAGCMRRRSALRLRVFRWHVYACV